jgi:hypothetical protein
VKPMTETAIMQRQVFLPAVLALLLSLAGCTAGTTSSGSFASHGVDYIPAFDTPYAGGGGH